MRMLRNPMWRGFYSDMRPFTKPDFHPDQVDTDALTTHWQRELFGADGELVGHLR
ncbi:hypothetical protein H7J77_17445 [Mycolicibacillus parakoreensis]|uniref:Uncharacterized protein n=1 Tax=Mycolicibacillus parakoreensis TaxID=1069221 RepID=A0ABY3TVF8_9MYCO|nr:hypothetical protein [Mycolicibacillus parakoreensis]MCV7317323.1 hypothetical protein [Mycolicibacillus parakoreensis]ULN51638.1 hypothetical protein MIU77_12060 [Mycolicibacillus parakoreensis]